MKKFLIAVIIVIALSITSIVTPLLWWSINPVNANTQATTSYGMIKVASNYSNDRYVEVYLLNYNGKKFLVTKSWSGHWYGGTSSSIIEMSEWHGDK